MDQAIHDFVFSLVAEQGASPNTLGAYRADLRQLEDYLRRRQVTSWAAVDADMLAAFATHLAEREYAAASIARKVAATRSFFQYLRQAGAVDQDPSVALGAPPIERGAPHLVSEHEVARLFREMPSSTPAGLRDVAMLQVLYATGLRVSELIALTLADVAPELTHVRCATRDGRERTLPLSPAAQSALHAYLAGGRPRLVRGVAPNVVFLNHHGEPLTRQGFWLILKGYARAAGIAEVTPHSMRHAFAVNLIGQGMDLRGVQERLGHAHLSTTQLYRHFQRTCPAAEERGPQPAEAVAASSVGAHGMAERRLEGEADR